PDHADRAPELHFRDRLQCLCRAAGAGRSCNALDRSGGDVAQLARRGGQFAQACQGGAMSGLAFLIPIALGLGMLGLAAFFWAMKRGQFEDLDGAAQRILIDDEEDER
ncbi:MAG TPA: cbb3-type cytochrome oxidase assembly protein CcoS, partial [Erythrobacter sp.]|nr:cbb3-type cytochrome oxidase assembly protein CcoS [Erythrobacter sp.]